MRREYIDASSDLLLTGGGWDMQPLGMESEMTIKEQVFKICLGIVSITLASSISAEAEMPAQGSGTSSEKLRNEQGSNSAYVRMTCSWKSEKDGMSRVGKLSSELCNKAQVETILAKRGVDESKLPITHEDGAGVPIKRLDFGNYTYWYGRAREGNEVRSKGSIGIEMVQINSVGEDKSLKCLKSMPRHELHRILDLKVPESSLDIEIVRNSGFIRTDTFFAPKPDVGFAMLVFKENILNVLIVQCVP
jgi:hypothetical protein